MWHYTQGMALAHTQRLIDAEKSLANLEQMVAKGETENNLGKSGHHLLEIARAVLNATIADSKKTKSPRCPI